MSFFRLIKVNLKQSLFSLQFVFCLFGIVLLQILDTFHVLIFNMSQTENGKMMFGGTVIGMLDLRNMTLYGLLSLSLCALAASCRYCKDMEGRIFPYLVVRSSYQKYSAASVVSCAVTGFVAMFLGTLLILGFYDIFLPVHRDLEAYEFSMPLLRSGYYWGYILVRLCITGLGGAFFSMASFMLSAFVKNKFVLISIPVLVFYFLMRFGYGNFGVELDIFNVQRVYFGWAYPSELRSLLHTFFYTIVAMLFFGLVFYLGIRPAGNRKKKQEQNKREEG